MKTVFTQSELESHVSRDLTSDEEALISFVYPTVILQPNGVRVNALGCSAFLEIPSVLLDTDVPTPALDIVHGKNEDGTSIVTSGVLRDFAIEAQEYGEVALISLAANENLNGGRNRAGLTDATDVMIWVSFLGPYGFGLDDLIDMMAMVLRRSELNPVE